VADQVTAVTMQMGMFGPRPLGGSTLVFAPPLIFTKAQAERSVDVLDSALSEVEADILPKAVAH
jgi:adenosylmethionine-8-amino-7-oxononanoate aminotransferase